MIAAAAMLAAAAAPAQGFAKAIWGPGFRNGVSLFPIYHQLGVTILEEQLDWSETAPTRPRQPTNPADPAYQWPAALQQDITMARRYHIRIMIQIIATPSWANGGKRSQYAPLRPGDVANFATAAARYYRTVHLWMAWGEPNDRNFEPVIKAKPYKPLTAAQQVAPHRYARVLDAVYGALKAVSRSNLVIGGNTYTYGYISTQQWIANLRLPNGRPPRMDMYGHNPFSYTPPTFSSRPSPYAEVQFSDLPRLAQLVDRYLGKGIPLFLSEWTIPTAPDEELVYWVDPPVAARWITEALQEARAWKRIYALGWIHLYDDPPVGKRLPITAGGLITVKGKRKPGFYAFARG